MFSQVLFIFNQSGPVWPRLHNFALTRTVNYFSATCFNGNRINKFHSQGTSHNCRIEKDDVGDKFESLKDINNCITYFENVHRHNKYGRRNKHSVQVSMKDLAKLYPEPKQNLHNCYMRVSQELKKPSLYEVSYSTKNENEWQCEYKVFWPEENVFTAVAVNKRSAASSAAYKCLQWLHSLGKITNKGYPVVFEDEDSFKWVPLKVDENKTIEMRNLVEDYNKNIKEIVKNELELNDDVEFKSKLDLKIINDFNVNPIHRNKQLHARLSHRPDNATNLPVLQHRNEIIKHLLSHQVFIIQGDTGCGKSTQVVQIIMDYHASKNMASSCNIIVTQPRRISAISIAQRVAEERREALGDVVGYHVRMDQKLPRYPGSILFCTTGIFRNKIQNFPDLQGLSHIILDEAHVRTIDNDILIVLLKRAMKLNPNIKVIIMSATINVKKFQQYFDCPSIEIPGMLYPVKDHFMEDIVQMGIAPSNARNETNLIPEEALCDVPQIANLIQHITLEKPPGAILCFLPSWLMISKLKEMLENTYLQSVPIEIIPVHSRISSEDQQKIFFQPPAEVRKIILATDIAETGITIPDVVYVVDSATHKHFIYDEQRCTTSFVSSFVSKANIEQRKGRAGRVQPGESYHMISRESFNNLPDFPVPEILQISLEKVVLDCKSYSDEKAETFLSSVPDPPTVTAINEAISSLIKLGAIDSDEKLTYLGRRIANFAEHPTLAKALILSRIFECVDPMLTITAAFSMSHDIFVDVLTNKSAVRDVKQKYQPFSDHVAYAWLFRQSQHVRETDARESLRFHVANRLVPDRVKYLSSLRRVIFDSLYACGMIEKSVDIDEFKNEINRFSELDELIRGLLLAGTDQILRQKKFTFVDGILRSTEGLFETENGTRGMLTPETVNYHRKEWPSPFLTYYRKYHSPERRAEIIRESSMVSPLSVVLFGSGNVHLTKGKDCVKFELIGKSNVKITCEEKTIAAVMKFRELMWDIVHYYYKKQTSETPLPDSDLAKVDKFKSKMLCVLARALEDASVDKVSSKSLT